MNRKIQAFAKLTGTMDKRLSLADGFTAEMLDKASDAIRAEIWQSYERSTWGRGAK